MARLTIEGVGKTYRGGVQALAGLSLEVEPGVLGLLGPNGAGKSTLMRILATITRPTEGRVLWEGEDVFRSRAAAGRLRAALGYLPQDFGIYPNLSAVEFLHYLAAVRRVPAATARARIPELLRLVNLESAAGRPLGGFSGGMRQRVGIAQALLSDPRLLIVDEPTVGLDPEERLRLRNLLSELAGDRIVILSTHIVSDVEAAAGVIALVAAGRLVARATPEAMLAAIEGKVWEWVVPAAALPEIKARFLVSGTARRSDGVRVRAVAEARPAAAAGAVPPNLEDAYLYHLRRHAGGAPPSDLDTALDAAASAL
jgi:ABC-type multidrug transport system ATPase subunit